MLSLNKYRTLHILHSNSTAVCAILLWKPSDDILTLCFLFSIRPSLVLFMLWDMRSAWPPIATTWLSWRSVTEETKETSWIIRIILTRVDNKVGNRRVRYTSKLLLYSNFYKNKHINCFSFPGSWVNGTGQLASKCLKSEVYDNWNFVK